jgi:hypothetical protein
MWKSVLVLLLTMSSLGCAALSKPEGPKIPVAFPVVKEAEQQPASAQVSTKPRIRYGLVFGKTDFKGILKASFVRLTLVRKDDPEKEYFFYVGARGNQSVVPWGQGRLIEPGYFYLQLTPGDYEVTEISIPVGSALAEERVSLGFSVTANKINYLGTLDVTGTKERVHFGGVPIVKPGFEYDLRINDEFEPAKKELETRIPRHKSPVVKELFKVNAVEGTSP